MLTSIIEPGTYMIGTTIYKSGMELPLNEEEQKELDEVCEIFDRWQQQRCELLNAVHLSEEPFSIELAQKAHEMKIENFSLRFRLNLLIARVEKRLGGLLPLYFNSIKKKLIINVKPEESLVYTTKFISDTIGMAAFDFPRTVGKHLVKKENLSFDNLEDEKLEVISVFGKSAELENWKRLDRLPTLANAIEATVTDDGPQAMTLIVLWFDDGRIRIINADAIPSTADPNTRVLWNLKKILEETKPNGVTISVEKTEPSKITFALTHKDKGEPVKALDVVHTIAPVRETKIVDGKPGFAVTRMTPDAIDQLLA